MSCVVLKTLGLKHTLSCEGTGQHCHCLMTFARQYNGLSGAGRASASLGTLKSPFPLGKSVSRDLNESWGVWPCCVWQKYGQRAWTADSSFQAHHSHPLDFSSKPKLSTSVGGNAGSSC